jgi:putative Mg2+ transporter-C (MgtC) family protein
MDPVLVDSLFKLVLATVLGASIGVERGQHGRPAGLRTHALVCLASTLLIVVSRTGALASLDASVPGNFTFNVDPARMGAGIVTGIGFLGAGAILRIRESLIRGLTTAACIWFVAALGVAIGFDHYILAVAAAVTALVILILLDYVEGAMKRVSYRTVTVDVELDTKEEIARSCRDLFKKRKMKIQQASYRVNNRKGEAQFTFSLRLSTKRDRLGLVSEISALPGVNSVHWF